MNLVDALISRLIQITVLVAFPVENCTEQTIGDRSQATANHGIQGMEREKASEGKSNQFSTSHIAEHEHYHHTPDHPNHIVKPMNLETLTIAEAAAPEAVW